MYIILCEGKTDSVVINHYMCSQGFKYQRKEPKKLKLEILSENQAIDYFEFETDTLAIWNVAGCGNIRSAIEKIIELAKVGNEITALSIVRDKDNYSNEEIVSEISSFFEDEFILSANTWENYSYKDSYSIDKILKVLLTIIPSLEESGALETLLLKALREVGAENEKLIDSVEEFIDKLKSENSSFLIKERAVIKSKLGCTVNIIDPERTFQNIRPVFESINWGEFECINECLEELKNYK